MKVDYTDPMFLRFMTENIEKTQEKSLLWFTKNKDQIMKCAQFPETYKDLRTEDLAKTYLAMCLPSLARDYESSMVNRRKKPILNEEIIKQLASMPTTWTDDAFPRAVMLPIDPAVKNILNKHLPEGGRKEYLKARNKLSPEEKYHYDETTSNMYGWKLKDSTVFKPGAPVFGRSNGFSRELRSRSGPHPDPPHYNLPPIDPYCKC